MFQTNKRRAGQKSGFIGKHSEESDVFLRRASALPPELLNGSLDSWPSAFQCDGFKFPVPTLNWRGVVSRSPHD
ncbi:hypothetical protein EYF80_017293 [Liparis tanakae]|uniref:Uncharacterized protein n=1 Tax=Liparis tanakae TaxID=230148 RepID=A0A4Z2I3F8_9TELE|nr:hypothetical protein EYF80_017293 [Liparis tanakae]